MQPHNTSNSTTTSNNPSRRLSRQRPLGSERLRKNRKREAAEKDEEQDFSMGKKGRTDNHSRFDGELQNSKNPKINQR